MRLPSLTLIALMGLTAGASAPETLVREVLGGRLQTGKDIKMRVKNWQSDWLRA